MPIAVVIEDDKHKKGSNLNPSLFHSAWSYWEYEKPILHVLCPVTSVDMH